MAMNKPIPRVIVSDQVEEVVAEGGSVIIQCLESVSKKGTAVVGKWGYHILSPDKKTERMVILKLTREQEITLTALGVMSRLMSWGLPTVALPTVEGHLIEVFSDGSCVPMVDHGKKPSTTAKINMLAKKMNPKVADQSNAIGDLILEVAKSLDTETIKNVRKRLKTLL